MTNDDPDKTARAAPQIDASEDKEDVAEIVQGRGRNGGCLFKQAASIFES